ncbi:MAG TPA: FmdB family zinc ribbon protein [Anaerolineales bacterium]|jgi:putative FmdB family regulatory protein
MPLYTYRCESCGVQFDQQQRFSDSPLRDCPECGEPALRKLFQPVGVVFKGSGFYVTDNRSASRGGRDSSTSNAKDDSGKKDESKSEPAKAEATTESKPDKSKSSDD